MQPQPAPLRSGLRPRAVVCGAAALLVASFVALAWAVPADEPVRGPRHLGAVHEIELLGRDHVWRVRYPGADARLGTADDVEGRGRVFVPTGVPTRVHLRSGDYIYALRVPELAVNEVAVPDLDFEVRLEDVPAGTYPLQGGEMCGTPRPGLQGHLVVSSPDAYWQALEALERP